MKKAGLLVFIVVVASSACLGAPRGEPATVPISSPTEISSFTAPPPTANIPTLPPPTESPTEIPDILNLPLSFISHESILSYLKALTAIQPYSGWRNSATKGEAEAMDYVVNTLGGFEFLQDLGLEQKRQTFHVFLATEIWEARLSISINEQEIEIPANAPRGHRNVIQQALHFDSDGVLNDSQPNPLEVLGEVVLLRSPGEEEIEGKIVFLDYAALPSFIGWRGAGAGVLTDLIEKGASAVVLVTDSSSENAGKFVGDGILIEELDAQSIVPILYVRLEDFNTAGIKGWEDLAQIDEARLIWDTDVFSPGTSSNLVVRIPGVDSTRAVILGAHIDSPNSPGALDNGIASAVLLEVAQVLDRTKTQPPVDIYLVWFGSEELWVYGSSYFVNTHQEILDKTIAAFLMDGITISVPDGTLVLSGWSHSRFGEDQLVYLDYLDRKAASHDITITEVEDIQGISSDDGPFSGFLTTAMLAFGSQKGDYAHSPYDTFETARGLGETMEAMASIALIAALETGRDAPKLTFIPQPTRRAVIVASHTEVAQMTPATLIDLERALAWEGFDVDVIPYGQPVTPDELTDAGLVIVLPVIDYPSEGGDLTMYDDAWGDEEIEALVDYVNLGGLLVLTNSANRIQMMKLQFETNEDWEDANALAGRFGAIFSAEIIPSSSIRIDEEHPLLEGKGQLSLIGNNCLAFDMQDGTALADYMGKLVMGLIDYGDQGGQVLILCDVSILGIEGALAPENDNLQFLRNLASYAINRTKP